MVSKENQNDSEGPRFGPKKKAGLWDEYIDKYIIISSQNGKSFAGKLIEIKEGCYGILSPFQAGKYREKGPKTELNRGRSMIFLSRSNIEPTTKKSLENFCKFENKKREKKEKNS